MTEARIEEASLRGAVDGALLQVRLRNATAVALLRLLARLFMSGVYLLALRAPSSATLGTLAGVNVTHLAVAVLVFELLRRRWRPGAVALVAAITDVAAVGIAGVSLVAGAAPQLAIAAVGYLNGLMVLVLLFAAVALPTRQAAGVTAVGVALQVAIAAWAGVPRPFVLAIGVVLTTAGAGAIWTGLRVTRLAARLATEAYLATRERAHAEELARANAVIAAQHDELLAATRQAEQRVRLLVHDLKNPLSSVLQYVDLAAIYTARPDGAARAREHLQHASAEGRRLADMIGDLLLLSGLESGARRLDRGALALGDLLDAIEHSWGDRAREAGIAFRRVCEDDLVIRVDHDLVRRMVENLLANALRHCRPGDLVELAGWSEGGRARVAVRNTGPEVPPEVRARLFDRNVTGGAREWHNVGLGLHLCRLVAEAHGGAIELVDRPGWSVSFEATLTEGGTGSLDLASAAPAR